MLQKKKLSCNKVRFNSVIANRAKKMYHKMAGLFIRYKGQKMDMTMNVLPDQALQVGFRVRT